TNDCTSSGRMFMSRVCSATRAALLADRIAPKVASASTRVPPAVANELIVCQSATCLELAVGHQLDGVLHLHHAEVPAAALERVVHGVAKNLLRLARQLRRDRGRRGEVVVLLRAQPSEAV